MKTESIPFFLFLGGSDHEGATSKLKAAGCEYKKKFLESRLENWESIFEYLRAENLYGVLVKLINTTYELMASLEYAEATERLFSTLQHLPHIIFVHESFFTGVSDRTSLPDATNNDPYFMTDSYFEPPEPQVIKHIHTLMD